MVDNIPFTAAMIPVVDQLGGANDDAYWWALALGACFGGNATIVAAAANVAASGMAARAGTPIGFVFFMRIGVPVTLVSLVLEHRLRHGAVRMSREVTPTELVRVTRHRSCTSTSRSSRPSAGSSTASCPRFR